MKDDVHRYFIAVLPPPGISDQVRIIQTELSERYHTRGALRSPPHVTLHMPFNWKARKEHELIKAMSVFMSGMQPFTVFLQGFGAFAPRVIYVHVVPTDELIKFQQELTRFCRANLNLLNATPRDLPFRPHLTLAFRDLKKHEFPKAWDAYKSRLYDAEFVATTVHLLRHEENEWKAYHRFDLSTNPNDASFPNLVK